METSSWHVILSHNTVFVRIKDFSQRITEKHKEKEKKIIK